ncbi:MAG TPA: penicillin acylase family protein, partial [Candidatus Binatia bacterium]|nr:penicillin acylase family protein [Candidatus Binatia bacterium]
MLNKTMKWFLALSAATLGSAAAAVAYMTRRALYDALPSVQGSQELHGLRRPVEIIRDRWGVPHIYAQTEEDLFYAQGYAQAQDRLFQMDMYRRVGYGRLSEIAGPLAVPSDRMARIFGWHHAAEAQWRGMQGDEEVTTMAKAYAAGVNAIIRSGALPAEYRLLRCAPEPWHPRDGAAWGTVLAWGLSVNWQTELLRMRLVEELGPEKAADLTPISDPGYPTIFPGAQIGSGLGKALLKAYAEAAQQLPLGQLTAGKGVGSNNWVVSGQWTRSGRPMLANDPHLPPLFPTLWYENHLVGGRYDVTGFTSPGVPSVIIGHNQRIAWGVTNGFADIQDLFVEHFHDDDALLYEVEGGWERAESHEEIIHVRGRRKPLVEHVRHTRHGPVISDLLSHEKRALALRWACQDENNHLQAMLEICRAANWSEFHDAARHWAFPSQNVVYADVSGNIGYLLPGRVPMRKKGEGLVPAPGWNGEYDWQGWIPHEELPALINPDRGYVVTANNQVTGDDYPHLLNGEWLAPYRAQRIADLIESLAPLDVAQHARIQTDTVSLATYRFTQLALGALSKQAIQEMDVTARRACVRLRSWNGNMRADAVEPSLAYGWLVRFVRAAMTDALGLQLARDLLEENGLDEIPSQPFHDIAFELALQWLAGAAPPWVGEIRGLLPSALEEAVAILQAELGSDESAWQWGRLHYVELHNFLARIPGLGRLWKPLTFPLGGDANSVNQARVPLEFPPRPIHVIASCRMILDVGAWDNSVTTLPGGQSGHPASDHY